MTAGDRRRAGHRASNLVSPALLSLALVALAPAGGSPFAASPLAAQGTAGERSETTRATRAAEEAEEEARTRWFPDTTAFAPLLANPRESGMRGSLILADRPDLDPDPPQIQDPADFEGTNAEAEVAVGLRLPVVLVRPETRRGPSVTVEFETGIFTRFFLETAQFDLINADFRVGAPVALGYRDWEARIELRHISSHFGDDFLTRFGPESDQVSQEGFEILVARRLFGRGVRVYGGGDLNFNLSTERLVERRLGRWGIEYDPGIVDGTRSIWPFAGADFQITSLTDEVAGTLVAGVAFRVRETGFRLEARGHFGPSPMGQLRRFDEHFVGVGLRIAPTGAFF